MTPAVHELVLTRIIDAPREKVFRCWTEGALLKQWFAPRPWTTPVAELDVRPGGASLITMRSPEGHDMASPGIYLDVVRNERLVFTDAFSPGWRPAGQPFMVAEITLEDAGAGKTRYTARAMHWNEETRQQHEKMGFHQGWGVCADQLQEVAKAL